MGYTHYFTVKENIDQEAWKNYKQFVRTAIELINGKQWANTAGGDTRDTPIDDIDRVIIRGGDGTGEPFVAPDDPQLPSSDNTTLATTDDTWSPDGEDIIWLNGDADTEDDHETFYVSPSEPGRHFCKTARKPYDTLVLACIIAGEKMGVFEKWSTDANTREEMRSGFALFYKTMENM